MRIDITRIGITRAVAVTAGLALAMAVGAAPATALGTAAAPATVTIDTKGPALGGIAAGYYGFSFESNTYGVNSGDFDTVGNLPQLLTNLGQGVLRFGGNTVDEGYRAATPAGLAGLERLTRATDWKVLYSEDLGHFDAPTVTQDARAVSTALGDRLAAIACGNEPDYYFRKLRPPTYSVQSYLAEADRCLAAVRSGAPTAKQAGPDTAGGAWLTDYATAEKGRIGLLTRHFYPLSHCSEPNATAAELLSRGVAQREATTVADAARSAAKAGVPFRLSETNSASCSGIPGVSDSYASALWAADYALVAAEHGAQGVNLHGQLGDHCAGYTPFCAAGPHQYRAMPVYYGLYFAHLLGTGRLLPTAVKTGDNIAAHALLGADGTVRVLVENLTPRATSIAVRGTEATTAAVLHLTGPSLSATDGVRVQGAPVAADGTIRPGAADHVKCRQGDCAVPLAPYSAAVLTLGTIG
ncbi:hypothetical protein ACFVXG_30045 [Kitasatospora sp. NPDC058162]|uniref:hypothetical protein n=1 Tax=Kitasatospora sp. NPDC058162 TaxID=3346362 RepID=UPI0036DDCCFA